MMNPFEVLGVNHKSTKKDIDQAYRDLVKKHHPDLNPEDPDAAKKFKEVQKAYELLNKKSSNNINFRTRRPPPNGQGFDFNFFTNSVYKGRNIQTHLDIDLVEVLTGCEKIVKYNKSVNCKECNKGFVDFLSCEQCSGNGYIQVSDAPFYIRTVCPKCVGQGKIGVKKCEKCNGVGNLESEEKSISINVPPGIESGMQLVFAGQGEDSLNGGGISGDLIIIVNVKEHNRFKREGPNLTVECPVSYTQLCLGCDINIICITGENILVKVPKNCQLNTKFRVKGKGVFSKGRIGDMIVSLKLEIPKNITKEYEELLLKISKLESGLPSENKIV